MSEARKGENNPNYGKRLSGETKNKISENMNAVKFLYVVYKNNGGNKKWNDFQKALKTGDITFSDYDITVLNDKQGDKYYE